jgi:hypothetical protein
MSFHYLAIAIVLWAFIHSAAKVAQGFLLRDLDVRWVYATLVAAFALAYLTGVRT